MEQIDKMCLMIWSTEKKYYYSYGHPDRNALPEFNHEETSAKSKLRNILQSNCSILLKTVEVMKQNLKNT